MILSVSICGGVVEERTRVITKAIHTVNDLIDRVQVRFALVRLELETAWAFRRGAIHR